MNNEKKKRCIAFDMDTKQLEKYYGSDNWKNAYKDIGYKNQGNRERQFQTISFKNYVRFCKAKS